jgi:pSer/pThr/pTyr-binding forkhead associated (FHA) protein
MKVGEDPITIGRLPECDIPVPDKNVSRRHAEIRRQDDAIVVVDLGSMNGTRVNGAGVKERVLEDGDEITVGTTTLRFEAS